MYANIYESLVTLDSDLKIAPLLAENWRNPDDLTWVISLKHGIRFQDGTTLTAEDARASLEHAQDPSRSTVADSLRVIKRIEVLDSYQLRITTSIPCGSMLNHLTEILILPSRFFAGKHPELEFAPGTGPYLVRSWKPDSYVHLERNPFYWGRTPEIQEAWFVSVPNLQDRINGLKRGDFGILPQLEPTALSDRSITADPKIQITSVQGLGVIYLGMDQSRKKSPYIQAGANPFMDPRVRRAIQYGVNRKHIVNDILGGYATEASQMVAPLVFGFNPTIPKAPYAPDQAKALLAEAGYSRGFTVQFDYSTDRYRNDEQIGSSIAMDLEKIGIHVQKNPLPRIRLFDLMAARDTSFYMAGWFLTDVDASNMFDYIIHSIDASRGYGSENVAGYSNPEIDRLIEAASGIADPIPRAKALRHIMVLIMNELPYIPLHTEYNFSASSTALDWKPRTDDYVFVKDIRWK